MVPLSIRPSLIKSYSVVLLSPVNADTYLIVKVGRSLKGIAAPAVDRRTDRRLAVVERRIGFGEVPLGSASM